MPTQASQLGARQFGLDAGDDRLGDLVLQFEQLIGRPIEALGPEMTLVLGVDELGRDANRLTHRP